MATENAHEKRREAVKILMIAPRILDIPPNRADAVRLTNYASGLATSGQKVYCLSFGKHESVKTYRGTKYIVMPGGLSFYLSSQVSNIRSLVPGATSFLKLTFRAFRLCREERIDLIHAHWLEGGLIGLLLRLLLRKPLVFDPHDWFVYEYVRTLPSTFLHRILYVSFKILESTLPRLSSGVIAVNEKMAKHIPSKNLLVLPNCMDLNDIVVYNRHMLPIEQARLRKQRIISFVGQIAIHQGIREILQSIPKVVAKYPEACFKFAGVGEYEEQAKAFVKHSGTENNVEFLGHLSHEDTLDLITHSDVCLAPFIETTRFTSFLNPQKIVEYMALGKYIVATNVPMIPSMTENYPQKKLVKPGDVDDLASGIMAALEDLSVRTEPNTSDISWYDCSFQAKRLNAFYETLLS